jgi:arsenate reductase
MNGTKKRKKVLFICTHNSARSQMAEGILKSLYGDRYEVFSAGSEPTSVNPLAVLVLSEIGIDISHNRSKHINEFVDKEIDMVVTLCGGGNETCPFVPGAKRYIHHSFADPAASSDSSKGSASFREVRDGLKEWISRAFGDQGPEETSEGMKLELRLV